MDEEYNEPMSLSMIVGRVVLPATAGLLALALAWHWLQGTSFGTGSGRSAGRSGVGLSARGPRAFSTMARISFEPLALMRRASGRGQVRANNDSRGDW